MIKILAICGLILFCLPVDAQNKYFKLGNQAFDQYQYQVAIENYQLSLKKDDAGADVQNRIHLRLAQSYAKTGDWLQSASHYSQFETNADFNENPEALFEYAVVLQYLGENGRAQGYYQKYLEKVPADSLAQQKLDGMLAAVYSAPSVKYSIANEKILNSSDDDFGVAFLNKKGSGIVISSSRKEASGKDKDQWTGAQFSDFFLSKAGRDGNMQNPETADEFDLINSPANEGVPFLNSKYSTLYFTRCEKAAKSVNEKMWCSILSSEKNSAKWQKPVEVLMNSTGSVGHPTLTKDELTMIYASSQPGGSGSKDLWIVKRESKTRPFLKAVNLGSEINTAGDELFPFLANDTTLYFASDGLGGFGGLDIYVSYKDKSGKWSAPKNMGAPFNTNRDDFGIIFNYNNQKGYFCSNREGGLGGDDIYSFKNHHFKYTITGKIRDAGTLTPIPKQRFFLIHKADTLILTTNPEGNFRVKDDDLMEDADYTIVVEKENYFTRKVPVSTSGVKQDYNWTVDVDLSPIPETPVLLPEIRYDLDKWDLLPQYQDSLLVLVKTLEDNPKLQIELRAHTDSRATDHYNEELSQKRAQTVVDFLIQKGIEPGRLVPRGYGKTSPRIMEKDYNSGILTIPKGTVLNQDYLDSLKKPEQKEIVHQLNRRTEFFVLSKTYHQ
jgi:peptidoglycan-associated lipoprotein